jgi:hypothetical protein
MLAAAIFDLHAHSLWLLSLYQDSTSSNGFI